ncbi:conserved Plasmodium protein, unknown function [Plasmodium gallinaceum]|uniref:Uncharacterized protein n=1 Tax=Plasmodium gallinaceum TaxID=5849 RepID=A0A1J1GTK6_PLAGA|nr:conserved Plasmodium protein, unknown function [Plasmodium gallinaceum]CRG95783.1 conserved Plasmodium protein, unknown function [Plasmodium gallinaceum]
MEEEIMTQKNFSKELLEPLITVSVIFICFYMITSVESPLYFFLRGYIFKAKIFYYEIRKSFTNINYFALIFSSFFFLPYVLNILNYKNVKPIFCVNYNYYENILNYNLKDINIKSIFQNDVSENYLVNFLYSFKFIFHIFFLNDSNLLKTFFTFFFVYILLSLYAKHVNRVIFISSIFMNIVLSGFILVFFLKKFLNIKYNHCGDEAFSFLFLLFFFVSNPYLSSLQYNDRSLHPYHGTEIRFFIHLLFFIKYVTYYENFYEQKALTARHTFIKIIWLVAYYFINNYLPFTFSTNFTISKIFHSNIMDLLSKEIKSNISLFHFNVTSGLPFNYLICKISFFWIPYILLTSNNDNFKYLIILLITTNLIVTCTYLAYTFLPGIILNILLLYYLRKI